MLPLSKITHWHSSAKPLQNASAKIRQHPFSTSYGIHAYLADAKAIIDQLQRDVIAVKRRCSSTPPSHIRCLGKHRY